MSLDLRRLRCELDDPLVQPAPPARWATLLTRWAGASRHARARVRLRQQEMLPEVAV